MSDIKLFRLGDAENRSKDILGRVYEYFLSQFASAEGKVLSRGGRNEHAQAMDSRIVRALAPRGNPSHGR